MPLRDGFCNVSITMSVEAREELKQKALASGFNSLGSYLKFLLSKYSQLESIDWGTSGYNARRNYIEETQDDKEDR
jgi:hypothetical protein